jgi:hypothetical protein
MDEFADSISMIDIDVCEAEKNRNDALLNQLRVEHLCIASFVGSLP